MGMTALMIACSTTYSKPEQALEMVKLLINAGSNAKVKDKVREYNFDVRYCLKNHN